MQIIQASNVLATKRTYDIDYSATTGLIWVAFGLTSFTRIRKLVTRPYTRQHQSRGGGQGQYSSWAGAVAQI